jgi:phosphatidate cytidylyltransferase
MSIELKKRTLTSIILLSLLLLMYFYSYILIISLILISIITWIEFYGLISKIFIKKRLIDRLFKLIFKSAFLLYLFIFSFIIFTIKFKNDGSELFIIYSLLACISSDIGGLIFGKIFKGPKLTKISPNKTISGAIGSFILSIILIPIFIDNLINLSLEKFILITFFISLTSQIGDLFISFLKRKAKVKNTGDLLPGHGGFLDRIDGILLGLPTGILLFNIF